MPAVHYGENAGFGKRGRSSYNKKQISIVQNIINTIPVEITDKSDKL